MGTTILTPIILFMALISCTDAIVAMVQSTNHSDAEAKLGLHRSLLGNTDINFQGFAMPTSFHWTPDLQHYFVLEKAGVLYRFNGPTGWKANAAVVLDLRNKVFDYGDHGATSIWVDVRGTYLYMTYMLVDPENPQIKYTCTDYGQQDGRQPSQINGCRTFGMASRWPLDANGNIVGAEQVILDGYSQVTVGGESTYRMCAQFSTHSMCSIAQDPITKNLYISASDGAGFTTADFGQLGTNPCKDRAAFKGAFRAQDPVRWTGKIVRVQADTLQWAIFSTGHRNAWRIFWDAPNNRLLESETGWYTYEEINVITQNNNYAWPCYEGLELAPHYNDPDELGRPFHGNAACQQLATSNSWTRPAFAYRAPLNPPPGDVQSISAVAAVGGYIVYGDKTRRRMDRLDGNFQNDQIINTGTGIVELRVLPDNTLVGVDVYTGQISTQALDTGGVVDPPPPPPPGAVVVLITPSQNAWTAGSGATLRYTGSATNAEGREGLIYTWNIRLVECGVSPATCQTSAVLKNFDGVVATVVAPTRKGTLVIELNAHSYAGFSASAEPLLQKENTAPTCTCTTLQGLYAMTEFPAAGKLDPIAGTLQGVVAPATFKVVMYLRAPDGKWWIKPFPGASTAITADGSFRIVGWASSPTNDPTWTAIRLYSIPSASTISTVLGGPLPPYLALVAVAAQEFPVGYIPVAPVGPPPPTGSGTFVVTAFPTPGTLTPIGGTLTNVANPANFVVILYVQAIDFTWWVKPQPNSVSPIAADGTFLIANWASNPLRDVTILAAHLYAVPRGTSIQNVLGGPLPAGLETVSVASMTIPRGFTPQQAPPQPPPTGQAVTLQLMNFPAAGAIDPITGAVAGLANPQDFQVVLYLQATDLSWWIKPFPSTAAQLNIDGSFSFVNWASYPPGDTNWVALQLYVIPRATTIPNVLGGPLPVAVPAVTQGTYQRGYTIGAFPRLGTVDPVAGKVAGLCQPLQFKMIMYLQAPDTTYWIKPQPGTSTPLAEDGTFVISNWASYPQGDVNFMSLQLFVVASSTATPTVLGAFLPPSLQTNAVASKSLPRAYVIGQETNFSGGQTAIKTAESPMLGTWPIYAVTLVVIGGLLLVAAAGAIVLLTRRHKRYPQDHSRITRGTEHNSPVEVSSVRVVEGVLSPGTRRRRTPRGDANQHA